MAQAIIDLMGENREGATFRKLTVEPPNGKKSVINAPKNSSENRYVEKLQVNGKAYTRNGLSHSALKKRGRAEL